MQEPPSRGSVIRGGVGRPVSELTPVAREAVPRQGLAPWVRTLNLRALGLVASWGPSRG